MPAKTVPARLDPHEVAAHVGYYELTHALIMLCERLLRADAGEWRPGRFDGLRGQMMGVLSLDIAGDQVADDTVAGPWHLAALLSMAEPALLRSALAAVEPPAGVDPPSWRGVLEVLARRRPVLWRNHREAVATGFLEPGTSAVLTFPTGAGKSTVTELKVAATVLMGQRAIILVPTLSLLAQQANAIRSALPQAKVFAQNDVIAGLEPDRAATADVLVFTPESCLASLGSDPGQFGDVGLIVFDEAHLLHSPELAGSRRAVDANLCLLLLADKYGSADLLLVSAMIGNAELLRDWLADLTGRTALALNDPWKPTRQARGAVVYREQEIRELQDVVSEAMQSGDTKGPPTALRAQMGATPLGFFGLRTTWESLESSDYRWVELVDHPVPLALTAKRPWQLTGNANVLAASIASSGAASDRKVLVFVQQVAWTVSTAREINPSSARTTKLRADERAMLKRAIQLAGSAEALYGTFGSDYVVGDALPHHGLLLPEERWLHEKLFSRADGVPVLVATSTLAQGMNLPSEIVIIAGDRRFDLAAGRNERLEAQELLNAAGRAGRAGMTSNGLVVVIPNYPAFYDGARHMSESWFELRRAFSQADQCVEVADPIADLLRADTDAASAELTYLGRRLAASEDPSGARGLYFGSLGAFNARRDSDEVRLDSRLAELVAAHAIEGAQWIKDVVAATGLDPSDVSHIGDRLDRIDELTTIQSWTEWILSTLRERPTILESTLRRGSRAVFKGAPDELSSGWAELNGGGLVDAVEHMLDHWMSGATLLELEQAAVDEGLRSAMTAKCEFARRFVLRVIPDLAYLFGLPFLIAQHRELMGLTEGPLREVGAAVELGVDTIEKVEFLREDPRRTRVDAKSV